MHNRDEYTEGSNSVVVGVIKDLTKTVEDSKDRLDAYERVSTKERAEFKQSIEASIIDIQLANAASIVQLRKDFNRALQPMMLETLDSRNERKDLLKSFNVDRDERILRQAQVDRRFTILTIVVVIAVMLIVVAFIVLILRLLLLNRG